MRFFKNLSNARKVRRVDIDEYGSFLKYVTLDRHNRVKVYLRGITSPMEFQLNAPGCWETLEMIKCSTKPEFYLLRLVDMGILSKVVYY